MKRFVRGLSEEYLKQIIRGGKRSFLRKQELIGNDIDIQIRDNYINLYYKGASLIKFDWISESDYSIEINDKYFSPVCPKAMCPTGGIKFKLTGSDGSKVRVYRYDDSSIAVLKDSFKEVVAQLKANIRYLGKGKENTFEQIFIENNLNVRNDPDFIILDRQVVVEGLDRLDLVALSKIKDSNEYRLNLIELKYGEDDRIKDVFKQIDKYFKLFYNNYQDVADVYQKIIEQKKAIDRWPYPKIDFKITRDKETMRKIVVLGNINDNHPLVKDAKKDANIDGKTICIVQNNILRESEVEKKAVLIP